MNWALTTLFSIIGSILLSIIGNLVSDRFKQWLTHRSLINKTKRLDELKKQYGRIEELHNNPLKFQTEILAFIFMVLCLVCFTIMAVMVGMICFVIASNPNLFIGWLNINPETATTITIVLGWIAIFISALLLADVAGAFSGHLWTIMKVLEFEKYKQEFDDQVKKLKQKSK